MAVREQQQITRIEQHGRRRCRVSSCQVLKVVDMQQDATTSVPRTRRRDAEQLNCLFDLTKKRKIATLSCDAPGGAGDAEPSRSGTTTYSVFAFDEPSRAERRQNSVAVSVSLGAVSVESELRTPTRLRSTSASKLTSRVSRVTRIGSVSLNTSCFEREYLSWLT